MASLFERWKIDQLAFNPVTESDEERINSWDKIYRPFGINTTIIDELSNEIFVAAFEKHVNGKIAQIKTIEQVYKRLIEAAEPIKNELYTKRLLWETFVDLSYIKGDDSLLSIRLSKKINQVKK